MRTVPTIHGVIVVYDIMVFGAPHRHSWYFASWDWESELLRTIAMNPEVKYNVVSVFPGDW